MTALLIIAGVVGLAVLATVADGLVAARQNRRRG